MTQVQTIFAMLMFSWVWLWNPSGAAAMNNEILKGSDIIGKHVQNLDGKELGEIQDLAVSPHDGRIRYAVLSYGGILGMGDKYFAIPWEALKLGKDREYFAVNVKEKELENAPGFDKDDWPNFSDRAYSVTLYEFYHIPVPEESNQSSDRGSEKSDRMQTSQNR